MKIYDLRCEYRSNPIGLDMKKPRFSWKMESDAADTMQRRYHITVSDGTDCVWDCEKESDESVLIVYEGAELKRETQYVVAVEVEDNH